MPKKTYQILALIEADGQMHVPAPVGAEPATAELSDEAAASLLPLGVISGVIAQLPAGKSSAEAKPAAAPSTKQSAKDAA